MQDPPISILICTYNGEKYLRATLESVLSQSYCNYEVIIVDDGSTDGTKTIIEEYAILNNNISFYFRENHGLASSRNFGFMHCLGEWIAIIDQDDLCYPNRLKKQVEVAVAYPDAELIFSETDYIDESGQIIGKHLTPFSLPNHYIPKMVAARLLLTQGCYIDSESCFIKRSAVHILEGLDESLSYACDYEYFIRAGIKFNFAFTREVLSAWRRHPLQESNNNLKRFSEYRSVLFRYIFFSKFNILYIGLIVNKIIRSYILEIIIIFKKFSIFH